MVPTRPVTPPRVLMIDCRRHGDSVGYMSFGMSCPSGSPLPTIQATCSGDSHSLSCSLCQRIGCGKVHGVSVDLRTGHPGSLAFSIHRISLTPYGSNWGYLKAIVGYSAFDNRNSQPGPSARVIYSSEQIYPRETTKQP